MFFMGEYVNLVTVSALASVMFLGGWHAPFGLPEIPLFWFLVKIFAFIIFYMWIRATLPRIRYDLLMAFGWKVLIPVGFLNLAVTAVVLTLAGDRAMPVLTAVNVTLAVVVGAAIKIAGRRVERRAPRLAPASEAGG
jgi:NADH-quinone oxidoreductase subunit H